MNSPVGAMFARIVNVYDLLNHVLSMGMDIRWRRELAALAKGNLVLDLAAGTLDVSLALAKNLPGAQILAMDFCLPMLERGVKKLRENPASTRIFPCVADALHIPLPDNSVESVTIAFGIRNIPPRIEALREMHRVLAPGGRLCILEFGSASERILGGLYNLYLARILPRIASLVARDGGAYVYLARTIAEFPRAQDLAAEMREAGFASAEFKRLTGGIVCLHWGEKRAASA